MKYLTSSKIKKWRLANTPKKCPVFDSAITDAVVDHNHTSGMVRGVLHRQANAFEGKVSNAWKRYGANNTKLSLPQALRRLADYLEKGDLPLLHPVGVRQICNRFKRLPKREQIFALRMLKFKKSEINSCINSSERLKLYRNFLTQNKYE
jgi:hypothetical protein